jgi:hypothetical protein
LALVIYIDCNDSESSMGSPCGAGRGNRRDHSCLGAPIADKNLSGSIDGCLKAAISCE